MVAFTDIRGAMVYMARKYVYIYPEYEVDELINEFWLSPQFQTMTHKGMIWKACQWAFLAYHYRQRGRKMKPQRIPLTAVSLSDLNEDHCEALIADGENGRFEARDYIFSDFGLNTRERRVLSRKLRGDTLKVIGSRYGYTKERARQIWCDARNKMT